VYQRSWHLRLARLRRTLAIIGIVFYGAGVFSVVILTKMPQKLDAWDPEFSLLIGNEATLDRPWLGNISSLMIVDGVLDQEEIRSIFASGRWPKPAVTEEYQPILAYQFDEGLGDILHDQSQSGEPINMRIRLPDQTAWVPEGGLRFQKPTVLQSVRAGEKLFRRITATDIFSVSMWIQPENLEQYGPARIVSVSESPVSRNFTIGQHGAGLHFRVRDRLSGSNGARWDLQVPHALQSTTEPIHGVFVYEKGFKRVYVNGEKMSETYPPDWLTFIAHFLDFDSDVPWQRWMLGGLLAGGAGMLVWPLTIQGNARERRSYRLK
jgi:hypothetical protein